MKHYQGGASGQGGVSRRNFIKGMGVAAAVGAMAPKFIRADDAPAANKAAVLGSGDHTYEVVKGWGALPDGIKYGNTHGVQVDSQGRVIVHNMSKDSICIFDPDGKFIKSWGKEYAGGAHGLQLSKEGNTEFLYLATTGQHTAVKTTLDGEVVWTLQFPKECEAYKGTNAHYVPTNIAIAPNGDFYVADGYGLSWIHQYDSKAQYIRSWGGGGSAPGQMSCPHGIAIDTRGEQPVIVVADRANKRLQYFSLDGKHLSFVKDELRHPCHFDQRNGELLIPDLSGRVTIFDKNNKLVVHLGDNPDKSQWEGNGLPQNKWVDGVFIAPHGACWDKDGNIYVAEWLRPGRVTKLKKV